MAAKKKSKRKSITLTKVKSIDKKFKQKSKTKTKSLKEEIKAASFKEKRQDTLKPLYTFQRTNPEDPMSRKIFDKKPSEFTPEDIKHIVKGVNDRLYKFEKAGKQKESRTYQNVAKYAAENQLGMYNVDPEKGTIRVTEDLSRFPTNEAKYEYIRRMQEILSNQTSTVGGTNRAMYRAYKSFMKNPNVMMKDKEGNLKPVNLSFQEYKDIWKAYKDNVEPDKEGKYDSDSVIDFIHATREMKYEDIPEEDLSKAFSYYNEKKQEYADMYSFIIDNPDLFSDLDES